MQEDGTEDGGEEWTPYQKRDENYLHSYFLSQSLTERAARLTSSRHEDGQCFRVWKKGRTRDGRQVPAGNLQFLVHLSSPAAHPFR